MMILLFIVCVSSLPSWWWTKGPGLGDPAPDITLAGRLTIAIATIAGGIATAHFLGTDSTSTMAIAAFAGGKVAGRLALVALNPQPLPPKQIIS